MKYLPWRSRASYQGNVLHVLKGGRFFRTDESFGARLSSGATTDAEDSFLTRQGFLAPEELDLVAISEAYDCSRRIIAPATLDYLILVPTLRCNLSCSYCQVSRANEGARGFDWSDHTLAAVLELIAGLQSKSIKIEFQGGEPTLRPDLIRAVIEACARFERADFVICTNLSRIDDAVWELFDLPNVHISTSLDGDLETHKLGRTATDAATDIFARNLEQVVARYGAQKVSALPTIDPRTPPEIDSLIDAFSARGLSQIFLRPINFQGFARKRHAHSHKIDSGWYAYHERFVRRVNGGRIPGHDGGVKAGH